MDKGSIPNTPRKNGQPKEVYKEIALNSVRDRHKEGRSGRESPESGSLYSDYESGQQYEQEQHLTSDLPSGYNSGEQYDTLSTGYMSGEAYELPETRIELLEPTLANIDEVSTRSAEDLFTIQMPENQLLVQTDRMEISSSSSIQDTLEDPEEFGPQVHKGKRKKTVSYCVTVPMEKSPLGHEIRAYRDIPSDTDTTSCFDSDGTYMRSEAQSSDSNAALIHHSKKKKRDGGSGTEAGIIRGSRKRMRKAKRIIRNHEEFFLIYDNKYWGIARTACFWFSILAILASILTAVIMIVYLPHACDPELLWWQGSVILEISPTNNSLGQPQLDIESVIADIPTMSQAGFKGVKLINLYLKNLDDSAQNHDSFFYANDFESLKLRLGDLDLVDALAKTLHDANMTLLVDIPTQTPNQTVEPELDFKITKAIQFWGQHGVDGISLLGLENYGSDEYVTERISAWSTDFEKYSTSSQRILITSYLLPESIESHAVTPRLKKMSGAASVSKLNLLEAVLTIDGNQNSSHIKDAILDASKWDKVASQPWILWRTLNSDQLTGAHIAFQVFLPGTIALPWAVLSSNQTTFSQSTISQLIAVRQMAVPLYMNGNYKVCHGSCDAELREDNFKIHVFNESLVVMERHYNRRNRYMLVANFGESDMGLNPVASMYSDGDVVVDTSGLVAANTAVKFKNMPAITPGSALVIKLPK